MRVRKLWHALQRASPFGSDVLLTAATNIIIALFGLVTGILTARLLGPLGRGELAAIQLWPSFIAVVAMLGLGEALVYFSAREPDRAGRYTGLAIASALMFSLPFMAIGYLLMPAFLSAQSPEVISAARWYLLFVPLSALAGMPLHALRGRNDLVAWNGLRLSPVVGWLAVLVVAGLVGRANPEHLAASYLAMLMLLLFPIVYITVRRIPGPFRPNFGKRGRMLRYGLPSMMSSVPRMLNFRLDQMLIAAFLPAHVLGLYVVAVAWSGAVHPLVNALGAVLFPRVASQKTSAQQNHVFAQGSRLGALISVVMALVLLAFTPLAVPLLFGMEFAAAIPAALILVVAGAISAFNLILEEGLRGSGHPAAVMRAELGGLAATASSLVLLLEPLGIMGAALASLLGYSAVLMLLVAAAHRFTGYSLVALLWPTVSEVASGWQRMKSLMEVRAK